MGIISAQASGPQIKAHDSVPKHNQNIWSFELQSAIAFVIVVVGVSKSAAKCTNFGCECA